MRQPALRAENSVNGSESGAFVADLLLIAGHVRQSLGKQGSREL